MKSNSIGPLNPTNIIDKVAKVSWPFIIGFLLFGFSLLGLTDWLKSPISFLFDPIEYYGNSAATSIKNIGNLVISISTLHKDNNDLEVENAKLLSENELYEILYQENLALKQELNFGSENSNKIEGTVLNYDTAGYLTVNIGSDEGIKKDQIVTLGNIYIGRVAQVLKGQSKIRLPNNPDSILEVGVGRSFELTSSVEELKNDYTQILKKIIHGVMEGSSEGIKILNITNKSDVKVGDYVVVNDEKVGEILIVGIVSEVSTDPTLPEKVVFLSPIINYEELTYLFIEKND